MNEAYVQNAQGRPAWWRVLPAVAALAVCLACTGTTAPGGMYYTLEVDLSGRQNDVPLNADATMQQVIEIIRARLEQFGVDKVETMRVGNNRIHVTLSGVQDQARLQELICATGLLEFKLVAEEFVGVADTDTLPDGYERASIFRKDESGNYRPRETLVLRRQPEMTGEHLTAAVAKRDDSGIGGNRAIIAIEFDQVGAGQLQELTGANFHKRLAIVLDGKIMSAPVIQSTIRGGKAVIAGDFTPEEANDLRIILEAKPLPAPVTIIESRLLPS